jgi:hypothetical protein
MIANWDGIRSVGYNKEKKGEHEGSLHIDGRNETKHQICIVQQDVAI